MSDCAHCSAKLCKTGGHLEAAPADCPCRTTNDEKEMARYEGDDKMIAVQAAVVEGMKYGTLTRIEEIMEFAIRCGFKHLGLAFCVGLAEEGRIVADILKANGFEVDSVCCKCGSVNKTNMGLEQDAFVIKDAEFEAMCNPAGQAAVLDAAGCEFNIACGLCVGHDTLFIKNSQAPVTVLAAKDRACAHNPLGAIYTSKTYRANLYKYVERRDK